MGIIIYYPTLDESIFGGFLELNFGRNYKNTGKK